MFSLQYGYVVNPASLLIKDIDCENDLLTLTNIKKMQKHYLLARKVNKININFGVTLIAVPREENKK